MVRVLWPGSAPVGVGVVAAQVEGQAFRRDRAGQAAPAAVRVELEQEPFQV
jgi:hypothetical protein